MDIIASSGWSRRHRAMTMKATSDSSMPTKKTASTFHCSPFTSASMAEKFTDTSTQPASRSSCSTMRRSPESRSTSGGIPSFMRRDTRPSKLPGRAPTEAARWPSLLRRAVNLKSSSRRIGSRTTRRGSADWSESPSLAMTREISWAFTRPCITSFLSRKSLAQPGTMMTRIRQMRA